MTANRRRRTRATVLSLVASVVALGAVAVLVLAGVRTLADSTAGTRAEGQVVRQTQRLPNTATALLGVVDDDGRLTSLSVLVLQPEGVGGTIIGFSPSADVSFGAADGLAPIDGIWRTDGAAALLGAMESMTGLSFDVVEVADQRRFGQLITPVGDLPTDLPTVLRDGSTGEEWPAGEQTLTAPGAARAITAFDPTIADWYLDPARSAVWEAVAARVGAGIGSAQPVAADSVLPIPPDLDTFLARLYAAPVEYRALGFTPIPELEVPRRLSPAVSGVYADGSVPSVVIVDRVEATMLLAATAPARLGAPQEAPTIRIESSFTDADLEPLGPLDLDRTDLTRAVVFRLLFEGVNLVSVAEQPAEATPAVTQIVVADASLAGAARDYEEIVGPVEVSTAAVPIEGVDIVIRLGVSFAELLRDGG